MIHIVVFMRYDMPLSDDWTPRYFGMPLLARG